MTGPGPQKEVHLDIPPEAYQRAFIRSIATTAVQFARRLETLPTAKRPADPLQASITSLKKVNDGEANRGERFPIQWTYNDGQQVHHLLTPHASLDEHGWQQMVDLATLEYYGNEAGETSQGIV